MAHPNIDERRASVYWTLAHVQRRLNRREVQTLTALFGCSASAIRADIARLRDFLTTYCARAAAA
jgi:hypothetical protein